MSDTVRVELGARSYDVRVGTFSADATADILAAAFDPAPTGVAVLVDADVAERSPRVTPIIEALAGRLPRVERFALPAGEACKNLTEMARTLEWLAAKQAELEREWHARLRDRYQVTVEGSRD